MNIVNVYEVNLRDVITTLLDFSSVFIINFDNIKNFHQVLYRWLWAVNIPNL